MADRIRDTVKDAGAVSLADSIGDVTMRLFEACSFQDITGQRVAKVVRTLRYVEERVVSIIQIWGEEAFGALPLPDLDADDESRLLNGPQLEGRAIDQALLDKVFDNRG